MLIWLGIATGERNGQENAIPGRHVYARHLNVIGTDALMRRRRISAQHFHHRLGNECGVVAQLLLLLRMRGEVHEVQTGIRRHRIEAADIEIKAMAEDFDRSEEHTSELQSLMRNSYAVFCLKKKNHK